MTFLERIWKTLQTNVFSRISSRIMLIVVTVLCLGSLFYQYFSRPGSISLAQAAGVFVVPLQEGANEIGGLLYRAQDERITLINAEEKIDELENEIEVLKKKVSDLNSLAIENEELRQLLHAKERLQAYEMEEAEIIGSDGVNCFERFTINKGSLDGIRVDMNVINSDGLVGIVSYVGLNYSIVTSIIEDGMNVSVMTNNTHRNCIVSGDLKKSGASLLKLENALSDIDFKEDSTLVTSSISDKFLPNLPVGYAENMTMNNGGLTQSGEVRTAVDFTRLSEVMVITTMKEELKETEEAK